MAFSSDFCFAIIDFFEANLGEFQYSILKLFKAETASNLEIVFFPAGEGGEKLRNC